MMKIRWVCKRFFISVLVIYTVFNSSCKEERAVNATVISLAPNTNTINLSSFIEDINYIPLKYDAENKTRVGQLVRLEIFEDLIFISHSPSNPKLSVYDVDGNHRYNIGNKGRGPAEYLTIQDFTLDKKNKQILIMDLAQNKLLYYNLQGNFLKSKKLPVYALGLTLLNEELIFYLGNLYNEKLNEELSTMYNTLVFDSSLVLKYSYLEVPTSLKGYTQGAAPSSLSFYKEGVNIIQPLSNLIFHYEKGLMTTRFILDFGALDCNFTEEGKIYKGNPSTFTLYLKKQGATFSPGSFFEFEKFVFFNFKSGDELFYVAFDKTLNTSNIGDAIVDNIQNGIFGKPVGQWNNNLVTLIEPMDILDTDQMPEKLKAYSISENSNPILGVFKVR